MLNPFLRKRQISLDYKIVDILNGKIKLQVGLKLECKLQFFIL
jgi:hypothetical protein